MDGWMYNLYMKPIFFSSYKAVTLFCVHILEVWGQPSSGCCSCAYFRFLSCPLVVGPHFLFKWPLDTDWNRKPRKGPTSSPDASPLLWMLRGCVTCDQGGDEKCCVCLNASVFVFVLASWNSQASDAFVAARSTLLVFVLCDLVDFLFESKFCRRRDRGDSSL